MQELSLYQHLTFTDAEFIEWRRTAPTEQNGYQLMYNVDRHDVLKKKVYVSVYAVLDLKEKKV